MTKKELNTLPVFRVFGLAGFDEYATHNEAVMSYVNPMYNAGVRQAQEIEIIVEWYSPAQLEKIAEAKRTMKSLLVFGVVGQLRMMGVSSYIRHIEAELEPVLDGFEFSDAIFARDKYRILTVDTKDYMAQCEKNSGNYEKHRI